MIGILAAMGLTAWATVVGLDLVTFPQGLLSRPLVTGAVAGLIAGDPVAGLQVGAAVELFALDVLPVGAARYPDYGPGVVAAVLLAAGRPWSDVLGFAVLLALVLAVLGGWTLQWMRRANSRAVERYAAGFAAGDAGVVARAQREGIFRDLVRSALLAAVGLPLALFLRDLPLGNHPHLVTSVAVGVGIAAAASGAIRSAGRGTRFRWLLAGVAIGLLVVGARAG